jgi:hypothetical protein
MAEVVPEEFLWVTSSTVDSRKRSIMSGISPDWPSSFRYVTIGCHSS